jgi:DNA primase
MTAAPELEKMFHKHLLFNYDLCKEDFIVLVEGVFDALRLGDGACATFGTQFMAEQLLLVKPFKRVFMLYDNEFEAQEKAKKASGLISNLISGEVMVVNLGGSKDPDNLSDDDARCLMSEFRRVAR